MLGSCVCDGARALFLLSFPPFFAAGREGGRLSKVHVNDQV